MRITTGVTAAGTALLVASAPANATATKYPAIQSTIKYSTTGSVTSYFGNYARATSAVFYDPSTGTYTIRDTGSLSITSAFAPANVDAGASDSTFTIYSKNSGTETFRVLNQGATNPVIQLTYVDYGEWKRATTANGTTSTNDTYLVWGQKTPAASVPRTGGATYTTIYDGSFVNKNGVYALDGSGGITADFLHGGLTYTANLNGLPTGALAIGGSGTITFRSGYFNASGSNSGYTMNLNGTFYGPSAEEVGGLFQLKGNGGNGQGAFVGKQ